MNQELQRIRALLTPVVEEAGLYLDNVSQARQNATFVLQIIIDTADGTGFVTSSDLANISRIVSQELDSIDPFNGEYLLEVSSPGAERELREPRHWRREIGHLIRVKLRDGLRFVGRLTTVGDESVVLDVDGQSTTISYGQIKRARPRVEFGSEE